MKTLTIYLDIHPAQRRQIPTAPIAGVEPETTETGEATHLALLFAVRHQFVFEDLQALHAVVDPLRLLPDLKAKIRFDGGKLPDEGPRRSAGRRPHNAPHCRQKKPGAGRQPYRGTRPRTKNRTKDRQETSR